MKKIIRLIALIMILVMILGACGKKNTEEGAEPETPAVTDDSLTDATDTSSVTNGTGSDAGEPSASEDPSGRETAETTTETFFSDLTPGEYKTDGFAAEADLAAEGAYSASLSSGVIDPGKSLIAAPEGAYVVDEAYVDAYAGEPGEGPEYPGYLPTPRSGLLTAAEWNDNRNFAFLKSLLVKGQDGSAFSDYFKAWEIEPFSRLTVHATGNGGASVANAEVKVYASDSSLLWTSRTNVNGTAYTYYSVASSDAVPARVELTSSQETISYDLAPSDLDEDAVIELSFEKYTPASKSLDLMFMIDTTGSMGDELMYLQAELEDVINRVKNDNPNLTLRLSVNFYRDLEDDYIVRSYPFSENIEEQLRALKVEYADGGGDYEEAVELALDDAVSNHDWNADSVKLMFLVLDAPPHNTASVRNSLTASLKKASEEGIRIIPIAASGVDKSTEFLLRSFAMITGGTYTFLTDDSGIGGSHLTPTVGEYVVEQLCDLIVRLVNEYLTGVEELPKPAQISDRPVQVPVDPFLPEPIDDIGIPTYPDHTMDTLLVSLVEGTDAAAKQALLDKYPEYGLTIKYDYDSMDVIAIHIEKELDDPGLFKLMELLESEDCVVSCELDFLMTIYEPGIESADY